MIKLNMLVWFVNQLESNGLSRSHPVHMATAAVVANWHCVAKAWQGGKARAHPRGRLASASCDSVRVLGQSPWAACSLACAVGHEPLLADEFARLSAKVVDHAAKPTAHARQQVCSCWCQCLVAWLPDRRPHRDQFMIRLARMNTKVSRWSRNDCAGLR